MTFYENNHKLVELPFTSDTYYNMYNEKRRFSICKGKTRNVHIL